MRIGALLVAVAVALALADCRGSGGAAGSGGTTDSGGGGGAGRSGGTTGGGGTTITGGNMGGASSTGGSGANGGTIGSGGIPKTGGITGSGGPQGSGGSGAGGVTGSGGTTASGGTTGGGTTGSGGTASGGTTGSGGTTARGGTSGGADAAVTYQGPCDVLPNGCAEAFGMARAMTASYKGPLFQLGLAKDKTKTLDIGQTDTRAADMTTWSAFCGGTQSNCVISKIYAQIHTGNNDLLPAVWNAPWGPNCSAGGYTCAAKFTIEAATSLPILTTVAPQEYALSGDNFATGINGGSKAIGLMYNGKPVPNQVYCCGVFGITHKYNAEDTYGTDFMVALAYGWKDSGGCCIAVNCGASNKYCVGSEEEENNDLYDYGTSPIENAMVVTQFDPTPNAIISYLNGTQVLSHSPPKAKINAGTAIHVGGGGDLSQPDPVLMREALITNNVMSASDIAAMKANIVEFYSMLKFP